ncbi:phage integrase N-terminal SAM-like domain-containing protein [Methanolobus sp. ZRKC2]|uniref:tyrosine-type recombinase/integrase n=1 Tax=Methanolobus sp. ZRKC2 TaxID=3125783 RepID=UPI00324E69F8
MELLDDFLRNCKLRGRTERTLEGYKSTVGEFLNLFPEPETVTSDELEIYLETLQKRKLVIKTQKTYFSAISTFYEYLIYKKIAIANPVLPFRKWYLDKPNKSKRKQLLSVDQMRMLLNSIPDDRIDVIAMIMVFARGGPRKQEFLDLRKDDVDFQRKMIKLPQKEKRYNQIILMDIELEIVMEAYFDWYNQHNIYDSPYLWIAENGRRLNKNDPNKIIQEFAEPVGLHDPNGPSERRLTTHCFRKFMTHHFTKNGMPSIFLQLLRGDSLSDKAWKDNYLEPEDLIDNEVRTCFEYTAPPLLCY